MLDTGKNYLIAFMAGILGVFAFAPMALWPCMWLSSALFFYSLQQLEPRKGFICGWLYGFGYFGVGVSWVYVSIHWFGNTPAPLAVVVTLLFVAMLALFSGCHGLFLQAYFPAKYRKLAFACLGMLLEALRSWIFTGFPWLLIAYSQTNSPIAGWIPIIGEYGVGFMVLFSSAYLGISMFKIPLSKQCWMAVLLMVSLLFSGELLRVMPLTSWTSPVGKPISVALIQGNIPQQQKWQPDNIRNIMQSYWRLSQPHWDADLMIWPEAAIPLPEHYAQSFLQTLSQQAKATHTHLLTGIPVRVPNQLSYYNALLVLGQTTGRYYKQRLVPFGEYVPFEQWLRGLVGFLDLPMSNMAAGASKQEDLRLTINQQAVVLAPFICYEIAYAQNLRQHLRQQGSSANLLVTISDDAWFGNSFAPWQHVQIAQFRSLQAGRWQLFASNDGVTAIINAHGQVVSKAPQFKPYVLRGEVQAMKGVTPWVYWGNEPIIILLLALLAILVRLSLKQSYA